MLFDLDGYKQDHFDHVVKREPVRKKAQGLGLCPLCGGAIERFDAEVFIAHGRCAPCHEGLEGEQGQ